jgi:hypothetical protein
VVGVERVDDQARVDRDRCGDLGSVVAAPGAALVVAVDVPGVVVGETARVAQHARVALTPGERGVQAAAGAVGEAVEVHVAGRADHAVGPGVTAGRRRPLAELAPGAVVLGQFVGAVAGAAGAEAQLQLAVRGDHEPRVADAAEVDAVEGALYGTEVGE